MLFDLYAVVGVTDETSQEPEQHTDYDDDSVLWAREIPAKNVDECDYATNYSYAKPPEDPVMNPQVNMHKSSLTLTLVVRGRGADPFRRHHKSEPSGRNEFFNALLIAISRTLRLMRRHHQVQMITSPIQQ